MEPLSYSIVNFRSMSFDIQYQMLVKFISISKWGVMFSWNVLNDRSSQHEVRQSLFTNMIRLNLSMYRQSYAQQSVRWTYLCIPKLHRLHRWSWGMDQWFHQTFYNGCDYTCMLRLKLIHINKSGPGNIEIAIYLLYKCFVVSWRNKKSLVLSLCYLRI